MISPVFTTIVLCSAFIWIFMKITSKRVGNDTDELLEKERKANSTRKQSLDNLDYITINSDDFPRPDSTVSESVNNLYDQIINLSSQKIVNFTGISNTDLKLTYGVANLNTLMEYDQNFTVLCRTIYNLGDELVKADQKNIAVKVLEKGVACGTDISSNYLLLADLYIEMGQKVKINDLISKAESLRSLTKSSTIKKLQKKLLDSEGIVVKTSDGSVKATSSSDNDNILPADILDILESVPYKSDDQKQ